MSLLQPIWTKPNQNQKVKLRALEKEPLATSLRQRTLMKQALKNLNAFYSAQLR